MIFLNLCYFKWSMMTACLKCHNLIATQFADHPWATGNSKDGCLMRLNRQRWLVNRLISSKGMKMDWFLVSLQFIVVNYVHWSSKVTHHLLKLGQWQSEQWQKLKSSPCRELLIWILLFTPKNKPQWRLILDRTNLKRYKREGNSKSSKSTHD